MALTSFEEDLSNKVKRASTPVYSTNKVTVVERYRQEYGEHTVKVGKSGTMPAWRARMVDDILALHPDKKRASVRRSLEGGRADKPATQSEQKEIFKTLGQKLPPASYTPPPSGGYRVTWEGEIKISKKCYERKFTREITGTSAAALAANPDDYSIILLVYFDGEEVAEGYCGHPKVIVRPL